MFFIIFILFVLSVKSQGYCLRKLGIFNETANNTNQCFSSSSVNLTNCCFKCIVNGVTRCGSAYNYNIASCSQLTGSVLTQIQSDCGSTVTCSCNGGFDTSELFGTPLPTSSPTTQQQTNGYDTKNNLFIHILSFIVSYIIYHCL